MSWHFLQGQEAESWEESSLDGAPAALLKLMPERAECCSPGSATDCCRGSRCGTTCGHSTGAHGEDESTLFPEGSPAPTSATAGTRPESPGNAPDSGERWPASLARYDRASSSWKTSQRCLIEGWETFSATWPRSGLMRDGTCWELPTLGGRNRENECGLWPTLKASDAAQYSRNYAYFERRAKIAPDLPVLVALRTPPTPSGFYGRLNPDWAEWLMGWPIGWTALDALETDKIHEWQQTHGASLPANARGNPRERSAEK